MSMVNRLMGKDQILGYCRKRFKYVYKYLPFQTTKDALVYICPWHGKQTIHPMDHFKGVGCRACMADADKTYEDFKDRVSELHGSKYKIPKKLPGFTLQSRITLKCKHHGDVIKPAYAVLHGEGCQYCARGSLSKSQFVKLAKKKHGDHFDYSHIKDGLLTGKVIIRCPRHGKFLQYPQAHLESDDACMDCVYEKRNPKIKHFFLYLFEIRKGRKVVYKPGLANDVTRRGKEHARELGAGWSIRLLKAWKIDSRKGAFSTELYVLTNLPGKPVSKSIMKVGRTETKYNSLKPLAMTNLMDDLIRKYLKVGKRHVNADGQKLKTR